MSFKDLKLTAFRAKCRADYSIPKANIEQFCIGLWHPVRGKGTAGMGMISQDIHFTDFWQGVGTIYVWY